jgi:hypothetical protein
MRALLRIIVVIIAIAVLLTLLTILQFTFSGRLTALISSGVFGIASVAAWFLILIAGPLASVQLWRLRRMGLYIAASLCSIALAYYLLGALFLWRPEVPLTPIAAAILMNGGVLGLLLSPSARGICS